MCPRAIGLNMFSVYVPNYAKRTFSCRKKTEMTRVSDTENLIPAQLNDFVQRGYGFAN